ncbi:hypothetical protein ANO11243_022910 [Dothideomycetidae sp. 11243]|nr:hypothetical protein ANO11243_022910 [fungal sp. No.11243]
MARWLKKRGRGWKKREVKRREAARGRGGGGTRVEKSATGGNQLARDHRISEPQKNNKLGRRAHAHARQTPRGGKRWTCLMKEWGGGSDEGTIARELPSKHGRGTGRWSRGGDEGDQKEGDSVGGAGDCEGSVHGVARRGSARREGGRSGRASKKAHCTQGKARGPAGSRQWRTLIGQCVWVDGCTCRRTCCCHSSSPTPLSRELLGAALLPVVTSLGGELSLSGLNEHGATLTVQPLRTVALMVRLSKMQR